MAKQKTNRTILIKMISSLDDIELAFLRERIASSAETALKAREEILKNKDHRYLYPQMYIQTMEKVYELCDY